MAERLGRAIPLAAIGLAGTYFLFVVSVLGNEKLISSAKDGPKWLSTRKSVTTTYTGVPEIDEGLVLLVTFFRAAFSRDVTYKLGLAFGGSLSATIAIIFIEAARWQNHGTLFSYTAFPAVLISQGVGAGIALPFWFAYASLFNEEINYKAAHPSLKTLQRETRAMAGLVPAVGFGFLAFSGVFFIQPKTFPLPSKTEDLLSAAWQVYPIWMALIALFVRTSSPTPARAVRSADTTRTAVATILFLCGATAFVLYYTAILLTFFEAHFAKKSVRDAFLAFVQVPTKHKNMADIAQYFLTWDAVTTLSATLIFVSGFSDGSAIIKFLTMSAVSVLVSPGAVACYEYWHSAWPEQTFVKDADKEKDE